MTAEGNPYGIPRHPGHDPAPAHSAPVMWFPGYWIAHAPLGWTMTKPEPRCGSVNDNAAAGLAISNIETGRVWVLTGRYVGKIGSQHVMFEGRWEESGL